MRILALVGSYRKNGNTDQIVRLIVRQLDRLAAQNHEELQVETIYLGRQDIFPCRGCRVCFDRGEDCCPCRDDLLAIKASMKAADGILVAIQQSAWRRVAPEGSVDYQYWKNQGWLEPNCTFHIAHRSNPAKLALARLVGRIITPFVV